MRASPPVRQMVREAAAAVKPPFTNDDLARWITARYPDTKRATINCQITFCTVNQPARVNVAHNSEPRVARDERYDFLYLIGHGLRELYDPKRHGVWCIERLGSGELTVASTSSTILPLKAESTVRASAPRRRVATVDRIAEQAAALSRTFPECLDRFDAHPTFVGAPVHFHHRTLDRLKQRGLEGVLNDREDLYWDFLYATLATWGLNRLGVNSRTRLVNFEPYRDCIISHRESILALAPYKIISLTNQAEVQSVTDQLQRLVENLCLAESDSKIVANSKTLHHLLPELVPPIDRTYTLNFFYGSPNPTRIRQCLLDIFPALAGLAVGHRQVILDRVGRGFNTSPSKVIDNAIVGFMKGQESG